MDHTFWSKQVSEPLFPDILWSRPESRSNAGKLIIAGGNSHAFSSPATAFNMSEQTGAGTVEVLMPDAIKKIVHSLLPNAHYAPSTPSGSFARQSLDSFIQLAQWSDLALLSGDFGRNSETAIVLESFLKSFSGKICITHDGVDYFKETPLHVVDRKDTLVVLSIAQLQKFFIHTPTITPILLSMGSLELAKALHDYTIKHPSCIVTKHNDLIFVAYGGSVSTTKDDQKIWRVATAAKASVFWMQNPDKVFEAATTSVFKKD